MLLDTLQKLLMQRVDIIFPNCADKNVTGVVNNIIYDANSNNFDVRLKIVVDDKERVVEFPVPFYYEFIKNKLVFDYRLPSIFYRDHHKPIIREVLKNHHNDTCNKFFNAIVIFKIRKN